MEEILNNDALIIEAYFLQESYEICLDLVENLKMIIKL